MKIICVSCFDYYETRMHALIEYFQSRNNDVKYLIADFNHFSKSFYEVQYGCSKQLHVLPYSKNISIKRLLSHFLFSKKVLNEIKNEKPDLIYCVVPPNSLVKNLGTYRKKNNVCKLVFDLYDTWPESFPYKSRNPLVKFAFKYWAGLRDRYVDNADLLISVSKSGKEVFDTWFKTETKVLMPSVSIGEVPKYSFFVQDKISFCYLGHVNHITDIELGTKVLGGIARSKKVELHIIGEGQNKKKWIEMLASAGVKVISHGIVFDDDKKKRIFAQCNMGLNIPRSEIGSTMALKTIEYMRYGLPFINSGVGDNEEMVRSYNIGINIKDGDVISSVLALTGQDLHEMHENTLRCYYEKFIQQDYDEIFSELISVGE